VDATCCGLCDEQPIVCCRLFLTFYKNPTTSPLRYRCSTWQPEVCWRATMQCELHRLFRNQSPVGSHRMLTVVPTKRATQASTTMRSKNRYVALHLLLQPRHASTRLAVQTPTTPQDRKITKSKQTTTATTVFRGAHCTRS